MRLKKSVGLLSLMTALVTGPTLLACPPADSGKSSQAVALGAMGDKTTAGKDIVDTAVAAGSFKTLAAALTAAGLVDTLKGEGPFTVFAPTDDAFAKLPKGTVEELLKPENKARLVAILTYHVIPGKIMAADVLAMKKGSPATVNGQRVEINTTDGKVKIDNASVTKADIACSNGVIHVIDMVIMPATMDVVETASDAGSFQTLLAAAKAAGLVEALKGTGPITVFAPTDEAFAKLGADTIAMLLKPENKQKLADVLKYHVVSGRIYADQAIKAGKAATLQGASVTITTKNDAVMIDGAKVIAADMETSNGVIHVIDAVIMPKM